MTRSTVVLVLASLLMGPAVLHWLHDDLSGSDVLIRFGLAVALVTVSVQLVTAVVASYARPSEPGEAEPAAAERRRATDEQLAAPRP